MQRKVKKSQNFGELFLDVLKNVLEFILSSCIGVWVKIEPSWFWWAHVAAWYSPRSQDLASWSPRLGCWQWNQFLCSFVEILATLTLLGSLDWFWSTGTSNLWRIQHGVSEPERRTASIHQSIHPSVYLSIKLSIHPPIHGTIHMFAIHPSVRSSVCDVS